MKRPAKNTQFLRQKINQELDFLKNKGIKEVYTVDLSKKFNSTRTQVGHILVERPDLQRKVKYDYTTNTAVYWEFI